MSGCLGPRRACVRATLLATVCLLALACSGRAVDSVPAIVVPDGPIAAYVAADAATGASLATRSAGRFPAAALAGGSSPAAAAQPGGGYDIAQRSRSGHLQVLTANRTLTVSQSQIAAGTSPSITGVYTGGPYEVAFQAPGGMLMLSAPGSSARSLGVDLAPGTSPSLAASARGCCDVAFQGRDGYLFVWTPAGGATDTRQAMAAGTSPSLAEEPNGTYEVALQDPRGDLETWSPGPGGNDTGARIATQTSPSIAALASGGYEIAFGSPDGHLSMLSSDSPVATDTEQAISPGTSPSIASRANGGWVVAYAAQGGTLGTESSTGAVIRTEWRIAPGTSPAEAASPPILNPFGQDMFGIATDGAIQNERRRTQTKDLGYAAAAGAKWLRVDINWAQVQARGPASYDWTRTDRVIREAEARGMNVLGTLIYTPRWAAAIRSCKLADCAPKPIAFAAFARAAVAHYAPMGVTTYEIWSEENTTAQWLPRPSPRAYTRLLKDAYPAIKRADRHAKVLTGGTSPSLTNGIDYSPPAFVAALYRDGAKHYFNAIGVHPYCWPAYPGQPYPWSAWYQTYGARTSVRSIMVAHGDARKQIWGTEFGAATYGPKGSYVSRAFQAQTVLRGFALWSTYRWAGPLLIFEGRDEVAQSHRSVMWDYLGLLLHNFVKKPAFAAYQQAVGLY